MNNHSFLFPAFVLKYRGDEIDIISSCGIEFNKKLQELTKITNTDLTDYHIKHNNFIDDELKNQLITYLISCLFSDILKSKNIFPKYIASLSMGLYSALYCSGSISFASGAMLIKRVFKILSDQVRDKSYKMLAITGFSDEDIRAIISTNKLNCEIVIKNNEHSYILTGISEDIMRFHEIATLEGAIHQNIFPVSIPYHSSYIPYKKLNNNIFDDIKISKPSYPVISSTSLSKIESIEDTRNEIINNLFTPIEWDTTINILLKKGETSFIECGPGDSLKRISKFIQNDFKVYKLNSFL